MISTFTNYTKMMINSDAFLSLGKNSKSALLWAMLKRKYPSKRKNKRTKFNPDNYIREPFDFSYAEAKNELGLSKMQFTRSIDELLAKGFLEINHAGGSYQRDKSLFELSNQYLFWTKGQIINERNKDINRGYRGKHNKNLRNYKKQIK